MLSYGQVDRLGRDLRILANRQPQGVVDRVLAVSGGELQNLQVLARRDTIAVLITQRVVGDAKMACGEHVLPILVMLECSRFANQRIDHMTVVDGMLAGARQSRHPLHLGVAVPHLDEIGVNHHIHLVLDQSAGNGVRIAFDLYGAAAANAHFADARPVVEPSGR